MELEIFSVMLLGFNHKYKFHKFNLSLNAETYPRKIFIVAVNPLMILIMSFQILTSTKTGSWDSFYGVATFKYQHCLVKVLFIVLTQMKITSQKVLISEFSCKSGYLVKAKGSTSRSCSNLHDKRIHEKGVARELRARNRKMNQNWLSNS